MSYQHISNNDASNNHRPLYRNCDYMFMLSAGTISAFGSKLSQIALPFLALGMTQSALWAGLLAAAQLLPYLLFSLPAGVWVDRVNRKILLVVCDLIRAALLLSIPIAYWLGQLHIAHLFGVVFVVGLCTLLFEIADLAALSRVVQNNQLGQARSLSEGIEASANVLGPGLGGLIISLGRTTLSGAIVAYCVDAVSYLLSAMALLGVRRPLQSGGQGSGIGEQGKRRTGEQASRGTGEQGSRGTGSRLFTEMQAGLHFIWQHATLRFLMLLTSLVNFLQAPISLFVILTAQERLGLGPAPIGLLFAGAGLAALLGSFLAAWLYRSERLQAILRSSVLIWAVSAFIMALAPDTLMLGLGLGLTHLIWPIYAVAIVSYRLEQTPDQLQGRVISSFRMLSYGAEPLGLALGAMLVTVLGLRILLVGIGLALLVIGFFVWRCGDGGDGRAEAFPPYVATLQNRPAENVSAHGDAQYTR